MAQWKFLFHGIQPRINITHLNNFMLFQSIWNQETNEIFFGVVLLQDFGQGSFPRDFFLCGESGYKGFRKNFFFMGLVFCQLNRSYFFLITIFCGVQPLYGPVFVGAHLCVHVCECPFVRVNGKHHTWLLRSYSTSTNEARERPYKVKTVQLIYNSIQISLSY